MMLRSLLRINTFPIRQGLLTFKNVNPQAAVVCLAQRSIGLKDVQTDKPVGTMTDVVKEIIKRLGLETSYTTTPKSREKLLAYQPKAEDLPARTMQDSFTSAIIPLSTDEALRNKYTSHNNRVRVGRLMEDMDMFAVWVCHQHVKVPNLPENISLPYTFVTILVDKVKLSDSFTNAKEDIRISGHVSWVGKSSIEIVVWLEQMQNGQLQKITRSLFLMAARNATNTGPAAVNRIEPANEDERLILSGGEERKKRRQLLQASSIFKMEPNDYEQSLMYEIYKRTTPIHTMELNKRILPTNCRWMADTCTTNTVRSFPENRNAHNKVFGGFLMRVAVETSWMAASLYSKLNAKLINISDIEFKKPINVHSVIKMTSYVVYTKAQYMQLLTIADVVDHLSGEQMTSNVFYLTFQSPEIVPEVLPHTYHETMWYIQGRRKLKDALDLE